MLKILSSANIKTLGPLCLRVNLMTKRSKKDKAHTIEAVARAAGVSTMTVSRVLRSTDSVAPKTRQRVETAMRELGYVHNRLAGALASSHSAQIAVIISSIDNIVFAEVLAGITAALNGTGYLPVIGVTDYSPKRELDIVRSMLAWRPEGFILTGTQHEQETCHLLKAAGTPVIELMELRDDPLDMCFGLNHLRAGSVMASHVLSLGHSRFAYLGSNHETDRSAANRFKGFRDTVLAAGGKIDPVITVDEISAISLGRNHMHRILEFQADVELVYFSNDTVAAGAMMYCLANQIRVPEDIGIASFSGLEIAGAMPKPITTIRSPRYEMGHIGASKILSSIQGEPCVRIEEAGFELIPGASA